MKRKNLPRNANIMGSRTVLSIKDMGTPNEKYKARIVILGNNDSEKDDLVHNSPTIRASSLRIILNTAAIRGLTIWLEDVTQAFVQAFDLNRPVYLIAPKEFGLAEDEVLLLIKPLYGLSDAGDYWYLTLRVYLRDELSLTNIDGDLSLYVDMAKFATGQGVNGLLGVFVDDLLGSGEKNFNKTLENFSSRFKSKPRIYDDVYFAGVHIKRQGDHTITVDQSAHIKKLEKLSRKAGFEEFRSRRHALGWLSQTRPEISSTANILSQVTEKNFQPSHTGHINKAIKLLKETPTRGLKFVKLDEAGIRIVTFADASFSNNADGSTQLGYLFLLADKTGNANVLQFAYTKPNALFVQYYLTRQLHSRTHSTAVSRCVTTYKILLEKKFV